MQIISLEAPPSKSISHRYMIGAALADGTSMVRHVLESDDIDRTREALSSLGAEFSRTAPGEYRVRGIAGKICSPPEQEPLSCFIGESGTTCRLLTALLASGTGSFRLHGAGRMHQRPMQELVRALQSLGSGFIFEGQPGYLPFVLQANGQRENSAQAPDVSISAEESSQYLSGLLLAGPMFPQGLRIRLTGKKAVSWPYTGLTLDTLESFGIGFSVMVAENGEDDLSSGMVRDWRAIAEAAPGRTNFLVRPGTYQPGEYYVEGDWSGASYLLAAGAIGPRPVRVEGLRPASLQGDSAMLGILEKMGARVSCEADSVTVFPSALNGIEVSMAHCPDLAPTVAALAAHARGQTRITGAAHLKIKESDRKQALAEELGRAGVQARATEDGLIISPTAPPHPPKDGLPFRTRSDHRMAMGLSLLGLPGPDGSGLDRGFTVALDDSACVAKSFPNFWNLWKRVQGL